jgi:hypothetical protein
MLPAAIYNAPLIGAVAALYLAYGEPWMTIDTVIPTVKPTHMFPRTNTPLDNLYISAVNIAENGGWIEIYQPDRKSHFY